MSATLLFAALFVGQIDPGGRARAPVDADYHAAPGDVCLLGIVNRSEERAGRRSAIYRADAYPSPKALAEAMNDDEEARIEGRPDGYSPRACTSVLVRERGSVGVTRHGKPGRAPAFRVEILEGEFRDRILWTSGSSLFRFKAADR